MNPFLAKWLAVGLGAFSAVMNVAALNEGEEKLYTRNFKVNRFALQEGYLRPQNAALASRNRTNTLGEQDLKELLQAAGVTFPDRVAQGNTDSAQAKAMFYSEQTSVLIVRASLRELDIVENALRALNVDPPGVQIEVRIAEVPSSERERNWEYNNLKPVFPNQPSIAEMVTAPERPTLSKGILTEPQFRQIIHELEQEAGVNLLTRPTMTTVSGRQARLEPERPAVHPQTPPPRPRKVTPSSDPTPAGYPKGRI